MDYGIVSSKDVWRLSHYSRVIVDGQEQYSHLW